MSRKRPQSKDKEEQYEDDENQQETEQMVFNADGSSAKERINYALKQLEDMKTERHGEGKSTVVLKPRSEVISNLSK